jgi:hypothetical protein
MLIGNRYYTALQPSCQVREHCSLAPPTNALHPPHILEPSGTLCTSLPLYHTLTHINFRSVQQIEANIKPNHTQNPSTTPSTPVNMKFTTITLLITLLASISLANPLNTENATIDAVNTPFDECQQCTDYYNKCRKVGDRSLS